MNPILSALLGECWAMETSALERLAQVIVRWSDGVRLDPAAVSVAIGAGPAQAAARRSVDHSVGGVAVLPLFGAMVYRAHLVTNVSGAGGTSTEMFGRAFRQALDNHDAQAIILDIDSPGGAVSGTLELAELVRAGRERKPVIGVANATAASAAYWILANCTEAVVTPSGLVGSIGVLAVHEDRSVQLANQGRKISFIHAGRYKAEGNSAEPLGDDARIEMQRVVDQFYRAMVGSIAAGRGVNTGVVTDSFGQGRVMTAENAKAARMVDRIETLDQTINRMRTKRLSVVGGRGMAAATTGLASMQARLNRIRLAEDGVTARPTGRRQANAIRLAQAQAGLPVSSNRRGR